MPGKLQLTCLLLHQRIQGGLEIPLFWLFFFFLFFPEEKAGKSNHCRHRCFGFFLRSLFYKNNLQIETTLSSKITHSVQEDTAWWSRSVGVKDSDNTVNFNMTAAILHYIYFMLQMWVWHHIKPRSIKCASQGGCSQEINSILFISILLEPNTQTTALWIHSSAIYFKYMIKIYLNFKYTRIRYTKRQKIKSRAFKYNTLYIYINIHKETRGNQDVEGEAYPCYLWYIMALSARKSFQFA